MELFIVLGAFVVIDILAVWYGTDSRPMTVGREEKWTVRSRS